MANGKDENARSMNVVVVVVEVGDAEAVDAES